MSTKRIRSVAAVAVVLSAALFTNGVKAHGFFAPVRTLEETCEGGGHNPTPVELAVTSVPITFESTTDGYFVLYVKHHVAGTELELPVLVKLGEASMTTLAENVEALPAGRYMVHIFQVSDPADVDGDCTDDITELADLGTMNPVNPAPAIGLIALNPGDRYGLLRAREPDDRPHPREVVIYEALPNE